MGPLKSRMNTFFVIDFLLTLIFFFFNKGDNYATLTFIAFTISTTIEQERNIKKYFLKQILPNNFHFLDSGGESSS